MPILQIFTEEMHFPKCFIWADFELCASCAIKWLNCMQMNVCHVGLYEKEASSFSFPNVPYAAFRCFIMQGSESQSNWREYTVQFAAHHKKSVCFDYNLFILYVYFTS